MKAGGAAAGGLVLGTALSLSLGWGIRGNFGHEYGAMIPGALATMAAALLSGRRDWWPRTALFGVFGALGWSFGGSISYMQVIAYTHSGHSLSVFYGFASLFLIGLVWGAIGGAGAALPACLEWRTLTSFLPPLTVVFAVWFLQDAAVGWLEPPDAQFRQASPLYWYDTDWLAAASALAAVLAWAGVRRRWDAATSLIAHMASGWWVGFALLVIGLGWRMTPPRGDNWAGGVGMVAGLWVFFYRRGWREVLGASLITGFMGGFGFASATLIKLVAVRTGWETNWHSVLEQTYGFINGVGLGLAIVYLAVRVPAVSSAAGASEESSGSHSPPSGLEALAARISTVYAVAFLLLGLTYLNLRKNPAAWVRGKAVPEILAGWSAEAWFAAGYVVLGIGLLGLLWAHRRFPLALVPSTALGRGQLLFVVLLWWMVLGNFERALVNFTPQRLVTEGVIHANAVVCTVLALLWPSLTARGEVPVQPGRPALRRVAGWGVALFLVTVPADWAVVRALYGDQFAGHAGLHIRFGPEATATKDRPSPGQPHP